MPCYDSRDDEDRLEARRKIDRLTDMLCRVCTRWEEEFSGHRQLHADIQRWWAEHKEVDRQRQVAEVKRRTEKEIERQAAEFKRQLRKKHGLG